MTPDEAEGPSEVKITSHIYGSREYETRVVIRKQGQPMQCRAFKGLLPLIELLGRDPELKNNREISKLFNRYRPQPDVFMKILEIRYSQQYSELFEERENPPTNLSSLIYEHWIFFSGVYSILFSCHFIFFVRSRRVGCENRKKQVVYYQQYAKPESFTVKE
ncbi:unnamed protein product [Auanema sp. JU1783]|nr:unnamed protein product [Auanema sp. JU1783]